MAKEFWEDDAPAEASVPAESGGDFANSGMRTHDGLPARKNGDGSYSTEVSVTVTNPRLNGGNPTNIPSLWGGVELDEDAAVDAAIKSGRSFQAFDSIPTAVSSARERSNAGGAGADSEFWKSDKPAAQQDLPAGVTPSTAGAGRGNAGLADYRSKAEAQPTSPARAAWEDHADQLMADTAGSDPSGVSVLQKQGMGEQSPSARLALGAGPLSQRGVDQARNVAVGRVTSSDPAINRAATSIQRGADASVQRVNTPEIKRMAQRQTADEWRSVGEWANDSAAALASGAVSMVQLPVNIIAPGSALHESLVKSQQNLQDFESEPMKARRAQLAERVKSEDGFLDQYAATVSELVTNPSVAIHETLKQAAMFAGVLGAAKVGGAVGQGAVTVAGRASPTLALGEAISGGTIGASAAGIGSTAGGIGASSVMAAGDAAGNAYDKLMSAPQSMWDQSEDYQRLIAKGMDPQQAKQEVSTAKARTAAMIAAPLGVLGFMGAEASFAGKAAARGTPLRTFATEMITEPAEEALTQVAGNYAVQTVNPEQDIAEGAGEAAGMATVTSGPFATAGAINEVRRPVDRTPQIEALRKTGDETAASLLERRQQKEQAAYTTEREADALASFGPDLQQRYRDTRMAGAKTGDAVVQTAARWNFEQAAQMAGLSSRAQEVIGAKLAEMPAEKAAGFVQKAITGLVNAGQAQPFDGMETLAQTIETQRDQMLDSVLATMADIETLEAQQDATQEPAQGSAAAEAGPADSMPAAAVPDGADAVLGSDQPGAVEALNTEWQQFPEQTGTLNVPRSELPQVKTVHRGPLTNFLNARGVTHEQVEVDPATLKPTQAEFSQNKVQEAADRDTDRSILISADGHIIDGHHQALAKLENGKPVRAIRLNATAEELIPLVREFPSSTTEQSDVQNAPQLSGNPGQVTQAQAVEAPAPEGGDAAATAGIPAATGAGDVQANGVALLGQNSQPLSEGGKPFKTELAARKEKRLHPDKRVVKSPDGKGFILKPMSAKQIAAQEAAARRIKGADTGDKGPLSAHGFILARGGLAKSSMADAGFDKNVRIGNRWLFTDSGKTLAQAGMDLKEAGFIADETENAASDIIRRSIASPQYTTEGWEAVAEAEAQTRFEDHLKAQQESEEDPFASLADDGYTAEDTEGAGFDQAPPEIQAEVAALSAHMETIGRDPVDIIERLALQYPEDTQKEFHERAKAALTKAVAETTQPAGRGDPGKDGSESGQARSEGTGESLTDRPDGTLSVKGDTQALRERLTAAGIPAKSILPSATGVVVGRTQATKAREVLTSTLTAPTKSDIEAQQARAEQADKLDARAKVKRESEAGAGTFELTREDGRDGGTQPMFAVDDAGNAGDTATYGQPDTRPEARINIELLGRDIAASLKVPQREFDAVRPYDARVLPGAEDLQRIADAFGSEVQGFGMRVGLDEAARKKYGFFGGVRTSGVLFLRDQGGDRPHLAVLGHELAHELRSKQPKLYDQLVDAITPFVNAGKYEAEFVNSVVAKNQTKADKKQEEFIGEVLSDGFMEPEFWRALGRKNPSLLQHVGDFVFDMIEKAMKALGYTKRTAPYLTDFQAVMRTAGEVMAEYGVAPRGARGDLAFQSVKQQDQTQTEAFRAWFGDSKVVDSAGNPMVMYHGTNKTEQGEAFSMFDAYASNYGLFGQGAYFTDDASVASEYTSKGKGSSPTVYSAYMSIKNPIDMNADADPQAWADAYPDLDLDAYHEDGTTNESYYRAAEEALRDEGMEKWEGAEAMQSGLRKMGHDGITHIGGGRVKSEGKKHRVFIAFDPEQIKSATGNAGSFDPQNPDIRFSRPMTAELFRQMTTPMQRGMKTADLQKAIAPVLKRWENGPNVTVVATTKDLPMKAPGDVHGVYFGGKVYLVAQNIRDKAKAMEVLTHEAIAHHGLREMLGKDAWKKFMGNIQLALKTGNKPLTAIRKEVRAAYVDDTGKFNLSEMQEADEIAAKVVEQAVDVDGNFRPGFGFVKSVYAKVAEFLRSIGIDVKMTMAELQGALVNAQRFLEAGNRAAGARKAREPVFMRSGAPGISTAIIGASLGAATSHPRYADAKAGDIEAAIDVARELVTADLVDHVRAAIGGSKPVVIPVVSVESSGRNKIPLASAEVLAAKLGLETTTGIVQSNSPKRTEMDGLDRIFSSPEFDGPVVRGQDYVILDDTLTQGATFAALAAHIKAGGGRVVSAVALTGKQYSAKIHPSPETLKSLREKHGDLESAFQAATGYGFDALTESEARYLANFKPAQFVRDRILAEGRSRGELQDSGTAGGVAFSRTAKAPASLKAERSNEPPTAQAEMFQPGFWDAPQETRLDNIIYELQDGRIDLKRVQEAITKANVIPEKFDARLQETLYPGRVATRADRFLTDEAKPLLDAMARNNVTMDELADYLHARHAEERNKQIAKVNPDLPDGGAGKNSAGVLMTTEAAKQHIAALSDGKRMVLDAMAKRVDAITQGTTRLLVDDGLEKQETIDAWTGAYKSYVPLFRDEAENGNPHPTGAGMSVRGGSSKRAVGSKRKATNILAHVLMQREAAITRAEKNRVAVALYGLALTNPNPDFWTTIKPGMSPEAIGKELQRMGVDPTVAAAGMQGVPTIKTVDPTLGRVVSRPNPMYKSLPGAVVLKVNGEDRVLMLNTNDPRGLRMAENLKNLDGLTKLDIAGSAVGKVTRWLASVNTQYNPAFGLVNLTRDTLGGAINLSSTKLRGKTMKVLALTPGALKGIGLELAGKKSGEWGRLFRQFQADGGQTGYREMFRDANDRAKKLEAELKAMEKAGQLTATKVAGKLLGALDIFNTTLENAVRLAAYREALQEGMSRPEAARLGRELTVDFNRKGRMGRELGPLYAFFNASVQGSARTLQTLAGPAGAKIIAGGLTLGVLQAMMLLAAGYEDDEIPEFVKARALIIPLGTDDEGQKRHFTIPLPLGLHVLPNTGRVLAELTLDGGKDIGSKAFAAVGEIAGAFNPLGGGNIFTGSGFLRTVAPTVVDPFIETMSNENFAGTSIEREKFNNDPRPGFERARESTLRTPTGQTYTEISRIINTMTGGDEYEAGKFSPSPEMVRYWTQVAGGGLLREIEKTVNTSIAMAKGDDTKPTGFPVLGRFYGEVDDASVQRSRYYDNLAAIEKAEKMIRAAEKKGDLDAADRIEQAKPEALLKKDKNRAVKDLRELNKEAMETVGDSEAIKAIDAERTEVMRELNAIAQEADKPRRDGSLGGQLRKALGLSDAQP